jgi:hypothetical protein
MTSRSLCTAFLAALILATPILAQEKPAAPAKEQDPLAPLAWIVGGSWSTVVKDKDDGHPVHVVNRPVWAPNRRAIIFDVDFDTTPHYYGFYAYNPTTKNIDFYYTSSDGELTTGTATADPDGKTLWQEFDIRHTNGATGHLRSSIVRDGDNAYWLTVFTQKDGQWAQAFRIRYERKP